MEPTIEHSPVRKEKPSLVITVALLAAITLIAGGAGFAVSATLLTPATLVSSGKNAAGKDQHEGAVDETHAQKDGKAEGGDAHVAPDVDLVVVEVPPITTNLADPSDAWIRLETSLVFEEEADQALVNDVHQDIVAYIRTIRLYNLSGGSGYRHLVDDLQERAEIRSEGRVKRVLIRSLVIE